MFLLASCCFVLFLTPVVGSIGKRCQIFDWPSECKVHGAPVPRIGGVAIYLGFHLPFIVCMCWAPALLRPLLAEHSLFWVGTAAALVFFLGFCDDIRPLRPGTKLVVQAVAGIIAYVGGIRITELSLPWNAAWSTGWMSLPITLLWFLLVINAINLIDGLDGLAAGLSLFSALTLLALNFMRGEEGVAIGLAALAGACLGFLRYNFNPATIFMGDSGSYFLGFVLAALSIQGSVKRQAAVTILIPAIALGLPILDTLVAPIRRLAAGRNLFAPDKEHLHHRLLCLGLSHRKAVLALYGATILLCVLALVMVEARGAHAAGVLLLLATAFVMGFRKLGHFQHSPNAQKTAGSRVGRPASLVPPKSSSDFGPKAPLPWWEGLGEGVEQGIFSPPPGLPHRGRGTGWTL
jgi:UDP-GlcNAc:undecaprenyl-phosphate GlcNAc-1-phosphate transferase